MSNLRFNHPAFTLTLHLFKNYLVEKDLDTEQAEKVTIKEFYEWVKERQEENAMLEHPAFPDLADILTKLDIDDEEFIYVENMFEDPFICVSNLHPWWPVIRLYLRKSPDIKVELISLTASIKYDNGVTAHLPMILPATSEPFNEGVIGSVWRSQLNVLTQTVTEKGLKAIYDQAAVGGVIASVVPVDPGTGENYDIVSADG